MPVDLSRIRDNPLLDHSAVLLQQGGLLLDADFNELSSLLDRRLRALASDVLGRARVSSTTPDAFRITLAGAQLQIGPGRLYVDGLLAENHGGPAASAFDPLLAEARGPQGLSYAKQPFLTSPPNPPTAGRHLVYLDVWEREITAVEAPNLLDPAVGVSSGGRRQVVWQVRVLASDAGSASCGDVLPGWAALVAPSGARLSVGTHDPLPASPDPCELPPAGGYRGLENQCYRVELHQGGANAAAARFKWSRDNASVAMRVRTVISPTQLELAHLGLDEVLGLHDGDWVEIQHLGHEQAQRSGVLRRIRVDPLLNTIEFDDPLVGDLLPPGALPDSAWAEDQHLRVRRWDQKGQVLQLQADGSTTVFHDLDALGADGSIPVPPAGTTLILEQGLTLRFDAQGSGAWRAGDHWVFAARTMDASVERLQQAAPRGIHHHYARLALWDVAAGTLTDCRLPWPPPVTQGGATDCCGCTVCVSPEDHASGRLTVQMALDQVRQRGGGTVCLDVGSYALERPLRIQESLSITLRGQGAASLLLAGDAALQISQSSAVRIEDLSILSAGKRPALAAHQVLGLSLQRLIVLQLGQGDMASALALSGLIGAARIQDCLILAEQGLRVGVAGSMDLAADAPPQGWLLGVQMDLRDSLWLCAQRGIDLAGLALHLLALDIEGNSLLGGSAQALRLTGMALPGTRVRVQGNLIQASGDAIHCGLDAACIEANQLRGKPRRGQSTGAGLRLVDGLVNPQAVQLLANQIRGFDGAAIQVDDAVEDLIIKLNVISDCGQGILLDEEAGVARASIENNHLRDIGGTEGAALGIGAARVGQLKLAGNSLAGVGRRLKNGLVAGLLTQGCEQLQIQGNQLVDIGAPGDDGPFAFGILARGPFGQSDIAHNQVEQRDTAVGSRFLALMVDELAGANLAGQPGAVSHLGQSLVMGPKGGAYLQGQARAAAAPPTLGVSSNSLSALAVAFPLVQLRVAGDCQFSDNRCHWGSRDKVAVQITAGEAALVHGNRVRGGEPSILIEADPKRCAVLGNVTSGRIELVNGNLGAFAPLNLRG